MANAYGGDVASSRFKNNQQKRDQLQKNKEDAKKSQLRAWKLRMKKLGYTVDSTNTAYSKTGTKMGSFEGGMKKSLKIKKDTRNRHQKLKEDGMATWNTKKGNEADGAKLPGSKMVNNNSNNNKDTKNNNNGGNGGEKKVNKKNEGGEQPSDSKKDKLKIKKGSARNFIKTKKGFARRGTPMAKRAEEREKARKRLAAKGYMKNR